MITKTLIVALISCSTAVYAADATQTTSQTTTTTQTTASTTAAPQGIPGGYNDISVNDTDVMAAAKFAVAQMQHGSLLKILAAQVQVVAGKNYKLQLLMLENGVNYQYNVVVFVPLPADKQPMQLTNVQAMGQVSS